MNNWDINSLRNLAGMPKTAQINESYYDGDDDEDPDVKIAMGDKRQQAFEKRNKKDLDAGAAALKKRNQEQKAAAAAKKADEKKAEEKPVEKKAEEKPVEKKADETKAEEAKRRGKAPNPESFNQQAKAYAKEHTRATFLAWAKEKHGKGTAYASALFAKYNPKSGRTVNAQANECYVITHPFMHSHLLAENQMMNQMQWIDASSNFEPMVFETEEEANKVAKYMAEWKNQSSLVQKIVFED